jgi:hypothetical protein
VNRLPRLLVLLVALLAAGGLSACGKHKDEDARVVRSEHEGLYLTVGELKYQVQVSRQLNPDDTQDKFYLEGIPESRRKLAADEVWFGVFLRVQNESEEAIAPSRDIEIIDTQEEVFTPIPLADTNVFAYRSAAAIEPGDVLPEPDTPANDTPIQGSLVLFKLKLGALDNRPLELKIEGTKAPPQTGIIDLDV